MSDQQGMGLMQVLMATGILFLMVYGMISLLMFSAQRQRYQTMIANVRELQKKMDGLLNNQDAWKNTFAANASFNCIRTRTACLETQNVITEVRDAANNVIVTNLPDWSTPGYPSGGFTERGIPCATFNGTAGGGNDLCPFTYKIIWEPLCTGGGCAVHLDPAFRLTARFVYNPSPSFPANAAIQTGSPIAVQPLDPANSTKTPVTPTNVSSASQIADDKAGKYDVVIWRTATTNVPSFRIVSTTSGPCTNVGYSLSSARGGWTFANSSGGYDPFYLVKSLMSYSSTNDAVQLAHLGTYDCDVSAAGFNVGGFQTRLVLNVGNVFTSVGSSAANASGNLQSSVEFNSLFTAPSDLSVYQVQQVCDVSSGANDLGQSGGAPPPVLASMTCKLVNP